MQRPLNTLGWACYLGASWTWVIGMLLPILLLRDFGPWGWVAFAVPNVVGAAAFGFVLTPQRSRDLVATYPAACLAFSRVTMAYQVIVLPWALVELLGWSPRDMFVAAAVVYVVVLLASYRTPRAAAVVVTLLSVAAFAWFTKQEGWWLTQFDAAFSPRLERPDLIAFTVAASFGFALCPYLDLTFHEARQQSNPAAFVIGFGVVFLAMIVFSLSYALPMADGIIPFTGPYVRLALGLHILIQSAFTVTLHLRQVCKLERTPPLRTALPLVLFLLLGTYMVVWRPLPTEMYDMTVSHLMYRVLLILYGSIFPVYVLVAVVPADSNATRRRKMRIALFAGAMCVPMAFIAFVEAHALFILPMLVTVAVARILAMTSRSE